MKIFGLFLFLLMVGDVAAGLDEVSILESIYFTFYDPSR